MLGLLKGAARRFAEIAMPVLSEVSVVGIAVFEFPVEVILLRGPLRGGTDEEDATLLYVGRGLNLPHFKKKYFKEVEIVQSRKANLFTFRKHMAAIEGEADVTFVDIGWPYNGLINKNGDFLVLPDWVCMVTPLADTWEETVQGFRKTMRKNIGRLIRKNEYQCQATTDPDEIKAFYDEYYQAFINSRYSGEVFMTPRLQVERRARQGVILKVMGPDGPVAGGVYFPQGDQFCLLISGMPEALVDNPPEAAISALYYFSIRFAFDNGFKAVNFMGTRAFPDDGLFQFKRKWGAELKDAFSIDAILFRPANNSPKAARFCELFPFIVRRGEELGLVLCTTSKGMTAQDRDRLVAGSHTGGLDFAQVVQVTDHSSECPLPPAERPDAKHLGTSLDAFSRTFTLSP